MKAVCGAVRLLQRVFRGRSRFRGVCSATFMYEFFIWCDGPSKDKDVGSQPLRVCEFSQFEHQPRTELDVDGKTRT